MSAEDCRALLVREELGCDQRGSESSAAPRGADGGDEYDDDYDC